MKHTCTPPLTNVYPTAPMQPDWTCGVCGRVWRDWNGGGSGSIRWWVEVQGPRTGSGT